MLARSDSEGGMGKGGKTKGFEAHLHTMSCRCVLAGSNSEGGVGNSSETKGFEVHLCMMSR